MRGALLSEVNANEQARSRGSDACPLHLLCKCGVPAYRFRAVEQLTLVVAPVKFRRKGLLRFWLTAGFYTKGLLHFIAVFSVEIFTLSPIQYGLNFQFSSIYAAALDWFKVRWRKQNEIGRSLHFNAQTPDNPRLA